VRPSRLVAPSYGTIGRRRRRRYACRGQVVAWSYLNQGGPKQVDDRRDDVRTRPAAKPVETSSPVEEKGDSDQAGMKGPSPPAQESPEPQAGDGVRQETSTEGRDEHQQKTATAKDGPAAGPGEGSSGRSEGEPISSDKVASGFWDWSSRFADGVREAAIDLFGLQKDKSAGMKKYIYQRDAASAGGPGQGGEKAADPEKDQYTGTAALVIVKDSGTPWERLAANLKNAPIIQEMLRAGEKLAATELGKQATKLKTSIHDRLGDAREAWETSQNPLVYKVSSVWDNLTSETELGMALREIRRADPSFVLEEWMSNLSETFLPMFFEGYLRGDLKALRPYLSEGMYGVMAEELRLRKAQGLVPDPHVLEITSAEVLQAKIHDHQPVLVVVALVQHINCVRDREGRIVEGSADEVRASHWYLLFARHFNEAEGALEWKVNERMLLSWQKYI
jgi:predicted lipid-binding transport protein (Tim44 family)